MKMWFHPGLKKIEDAFIARDDKPLRKKWEPFAKHILDALGVVESAESLADLQGFHYLNPHRLHKDKRYKYERYSLSPAGKKNSVRMTLVCCDTEDNSLILEEIDLNATAVLIEEVSNHYGD